MERISRALRSFVKHLKDARGVSLYEITAAVAMTGILAAVAVPVIIDKVSEAKQARAVQETDAIYRAMTSFQRDTGKMPGEVEKVALLVSGIMGGVATSPLPDGAGVALAATLAIAADGKCTSCMNMNDFLVRNPNEPNKPEVYQNWRGPYIDEIQTDPFDRAYVVNVRPLYAQEPTSPGNCGYGWVLSGGPDRFLSTNINSTSLEQSSDDIGKNNGKKIGQGTCPTPTTP